MLYKEISLKEEGSKEYAKLCLYILGHSKEIPSSDLRKIVLICPGGAYYKTSDREAEMVAMKVLAMGHHAAVLRYSVAPARYPTALKEMARSVLTIREHAEEWHIDKNKIVLMGFSAGGHLAASYGVFWREEFLSESLKVHSEMLRPNGMILGYPVITSKEEFMHKGSFENLLGERYCEDELRKKMSLEEQVNENTPKCFIWNTCEDPTVPAVNALLFAEALYKKKIPVEFHMYEKGTHGLSLANELTNNQQGNCIQEECQNWIALAETWLKNI